MEGGASSGDDSVAPSSSCRGGGVGAVIERVNERRKTRAANLGADRQTKDHLEQGVTFELRCSKGKFQ